jgi:hypothetical protein
MTTKPLLSRLADFTRPAPVSRSLGRHLARSAGRAALFSALLAAPVVGFYSATDRDFGVGELGVEAVAPYVAEEGDEHAERAARLVERHDCWTGEAPADVEVPGGVVMRLYGGWAPRFYASDVMVGSALDHLFTSPNAAIGEVYAFCR